MSILIDENTRLLVQGITGSEGTFHAKACIEYGTNVVAGCTPGKGGQMWEDKIPVFNGVAEAVKETGANASIIFVPAALAADAIFEAADAGISPIVCITEGIPTTDMIADYFTKPLQGAPFRKLRDLIMNIDPSSRYHSNNSPRRSVLRIDAPQNTPQSEKDNSSGVTIQNSKPATSSLRSYREALLGSQP